MGLSMSNNSNRTRTRQLLVGLVLAGTCIGGAAYGIDTYVGAQVPTLSPPVGAPHDFANGQRLTPLHLTASQARQRVLAGLSGTPVTAISIGQSELRQERSAIEVAVQGIDAQSIEADWLGNIALGAMSDLMRSSEDSTQDVILGGRVTGVDGAGVTSTVGLGVGYVAGGQRFASPADAALRLRVDRVAQQYGLQVRSLKILHPLNSAIMLSLVVPTEGDVAWRLYDLENALTGEPSLVEGFYLALYSSDDKLLLTAGQALRSGSGGLWFAEGQDARFGAVHSHLAGM